MMFGIQPGGRFTTVNVPLWDLIRQAYGLQRSQLVGGPDWIETARFDIVAKAEGDIPRTRRPGGPPGPLQLHAAGSASRTASSFARIARRESCRSMRSRSRARDGKLGPGLRASTIGLRRDVLLADAVGATAAPDDSGRASGLRHENRARAAGRPADAHLAAHSSTVAIRRSASCSIALV